MPQAEESNSELVFLLVVVLAGDSGYVGGSPITLLVQEPVVLRSRAHKQDRGWELKCNFTSGSSKASMTRKVAVRNRSVAFALRKMLTAAEAVSTQAKSISAFHRFLNPLGIGTPR